jgi:hypothetical protein
MTLNLKGKGSSFFTQKSGIPKGICRKFRYDNDDHHFCQPNGKLVVKYFQNKISDGDFKLLIGIGYSQRSEMQNYHSHESIKCLKGLS